MVNKIFSNTYQNVSAIANYYSFFLFFSSGLRQTYQGVTTVFMITHIEDF